MGSVCCSLSSFVSIVLDALERISLCTVCAMLTCCLLFTILAVLMIGIGIGYHYSFVANSVENMGKAAEAAGALRSEPEQSNVMRSVDKVVKRGIAHRLARREADAPAATNNNTLNKMLQSNNFTFQDTAYQNLTANVTNTANLTTSVA